MVQLDVYPCGGVEISGILDPATISGGLARRQDWSGPPIPSLDKERLGAGKLVRICQQIDIARIAQPGVSEELRRQHDPLERQYSDFGLRENARQPPDFSRLGQAAFRGCQSLLAQPRDNRRRHVR